MSTSDKFEQIGYKLEEIQKDIEAAKEQAYEKGIAEGLLIAKDKTNRQPTIKKFREAHTEAVMYGEEIALICWASTPKKAAKILEADEDMIEEVSIDWRPYKLDGEYTMGYYFDPSSSGVFDAYGLII